MLTSATIPIELAPKHIVSVTTYNSQFPGPFLRLKEGQRVAVDVHNETDVPEQLHWHGQAIPRVPICNSPKNLPGGVKNRDLTPA